MIRKRDDCESIEELIHLSIDGRLDGEEKRRLDTHLAACARCADKLERLRTTEVKARSIGVDEPRPEYWSSFSARVIEKIETGAEKRPAWSLIRAIAGLFDLRGQRLRLAAGIVSIALVALVGALSMRDRGGMTPSVPVQDKAKTLAQSKSGPPAEGDVGQRTEAPQLEARRASQTETGSSGEPPAAKDVATAPGIAAEEHGRAAETHIVADTQRTAVAEAIGPPAEPSTAIVVRGPSAAFVEPAAVSRADTAATPDVEVAHGDALKSGRHPSAGEKSRGTAAIADSAARLKQMQPAAQVANTLSKDESMRAAVPFNAGGKAPAASGESFVLAMGTVPRISAADTSLAKSELLNVIQQWVLHINHHPQDQRNSQGYVQVANAYYLLARLTHDEDVISQGSQLIQEYAERAVDPELKKLLLDSKVRIESFRGK